MQSVLSVHELKDTPDGILTMLNPLTIVIARTSEHDDAWAKFKARILHVQELLPQTIIIVRHVISLDRNTDDKRSWRYRRDDPKETAAILADQLFRFALDIPYRKDRPPVYLMPDNEIATDKDSPEVFGWEMLVHAELAKLGGEQGVHLALACTPTGTPEYGQHKLAEPLFVAMKDAAARGVAHMIYYNGYYDPSDAGARAHHIERNIREYGTLCYDRRLPFPPIVLGETGIAYEYQSDRGYKTGMSPAFYAQNIVPIMRSLIAKVMPYNVFSYGQGIYDTRWTTFDVSEGSFWEAISPILPKVADGTFLRLIAAYIAESVGKPDPETPPSGEPFPDLPSVDDHRWTAGISERTATGWSAVRDLPSTRGNLVAHMSAGDRCRFMPENVYGHRAEVEGVYGWWVPVIVKVAGSGAYVRGWVWQNYAKITHYDETANVALGSYQFENSDQVLEAQAIALWLANLPTGSNAVRRFWATLYSRLKGETDATA